MSRRIAPIVLIIIVCSDAVQAAGMSRQERSTKLGNLTTTIAALSHHEM
jgi:hypothetical protein